MACELIDDDADVVIELVRWWRNDPQAGTAAARMRQAIGDCSMLAMRICLLLISSAASLRSLPSRTEDDDLLSRGRDTETNVNGLATGVNQKKK
jgi:hypothetical protein